MVAEDALVIAAGTDEGIEPNPEASTPEPSAVTAKPAGAPDKSGAAAPEKPAAATSSFTAPSVEPTQHGPKGLRFDFNDGCRAALPAAKHPWRARISDLDTGNILFETEMKAGRITSAKRFFVRFKLEVWQNGESVLVHEYSAKDREVLIQFPVGTLGDTMGWFPYAEKFRERHGCRLTCAMAEKLIPLFKDVYPDITFTTAEKVKPERFYASYRLGLFFDDKDCVLQPFDFRLVGLHRTAGYILGVDPAEVPPRIAITDDSRPIAERYVCIGVQSTTQSKYWNNPDGWRLIVAFLKEAGYRVICIDQKPVHGTGLVWNHIPNGAEDETGHPLPDVARWLKHADFYVGLSSGISWLAWAAGTPVVMISGFSNPVTEFVTPYRVINYHTCNGCWNDPQLRFDHKDFLWCPRHKGTPRQFECTRLITVEHVKNVIRTIPGFGIAAATRTNAPAKAQRTRRTP